jgi:hypothetical protein
MHYVRFKSTWVATAPCARAALLARRCPSKCSPGPQAQIEYAISKASYTSLHVNLISTCVEEDLAYTEARAGFYRLVEQVGTPILYWPHGPVVRHSAAAKISV